MQRGTLQSNSKCHGNRAKLLLEVPVAGHSPRQHLMVGWWETDFVAMVRDSPLAHPHHMRDMRKVLLAVDECSL